MQLHIYSRQRGQMKQTVERVGEGRLVSRRREEKGNMSDFMKPKHLVGSCEPTLIHFRKHSRWVSGGRGKGLANHGRDPWRETVKGSVGGSNANRSGVIILSERPLLGDCSGRWAGVWSGLAWSALGGDRLCKPTRCIAVPLARMQSN